MIENRYDLNGIIIKPNNGDKFSYADSNTDCILIDKEDDEYAYITLTLDQAEDICAILKEIVTYYRSLPKKGQNIKVTKGRFAGCEGHIFDIDKCDSKRPLAIRLNDNKEFENCMCYLNFDEVEISI